MTSRASWKLGARHSNEYQHPPGQRAATRKINAPTSPAPTSSSSHPARHTPPPKPGSNAAAVGEVHLCCALSLGLRLRGTRIRTGGQSSDDLSSFPFCPSVFISKALRNRLAGKVTVHPLPRRRRLGFALNPQTLMHPRDGNGNGDPRHLFADTDPEALSFLTTALKSTSLPRKGPSFRGWGRGGHGGATRGFDPGLSSPPLPRMLETEWGNLEQLCPAVHSKLEPSSLLFPPLQRRVSARVLKLAADAKARRSQRRGVMWRVEGTGVEGGRPGAEQGPLPSIQHPPPTAVAERRPEALTYIRPSERRLIGVGGLNRRGYGLSPFIPSPPFPPPSMGSIPVFSLFPFSS